MAKMSERHDRTSARVSSNHIIMSSSSPERRRRPSPPPTTTSTTASSTRNRIHNYLADIEADPNSAIRPTEAQLRWAHLHRSAKVRETKARIDWLMQFPAHVSDVEGANSSDGDSTIVQENCGENDSNDDNDKHEALGLRDCPSVAQSPTAASADGTNSKSYLGTRRDPRTGKWVRRHFSQKRFPHLAAKYASASTSLPSSPSRIASNNEMPHDEQRSNLRESNEQLQPTAQQKMKHKSHETKNRGRKKVEISKGRRALLRVSARKLDQRKETSSFSPSHKNWDQCPSVQPHQSIQHNNSDPEPTLVDDFSHNNNAMEDRQKASSFPSSHRKWDHRPSMQSQPIQHNNPDPEPTALNNLPNHIDDASAANSEATLKNTRRKKKSKHKVVFENAPDLESFQRNSIENERKIRTTLLEDEISGLFTARTEETSSKSSSALRRRRSPGSSQTSVSFISNEDEERIRRFEEAYRAIMLVSGGQNDIDDELTVSTEWMNAGGKRWTRDPNISSAVSIDGRSYDDLQRTPTASLKQMDISKGCYNAKNGMFQFELYDRGATWLVHVPRPTPKQMRRETGLNVMNDVIIEEEETAGDAAPASAISLSTSRGRGKERERASDREDLLSPCQKKLNDIETKIQGSVNKATFDLMQNRKAIAASRSYMMPTIQQQKGNSDDASRLPPRGNSANKVPPSTDRQVQANYMKNISDNTRIEGNAQTSALQIGKLNATSELRTQTARDALAMKGKMMKKINTEKGAKSQIQDADNVSGSISSSSKYSNSNTYNCSAPIAKTPSDSTIARDKAESYGDSNISNDTKKKAHIDTTPSSVRTSTLRLLFSGIQESPTKSTNATTTPRKRIETKSRPHFSQSSTTYTKDTDNCLAEARVGVNQVVDVNSSNKPSVENDICYEDIADSKSPLHNHDGKSGEKDTSETKAHNIVINGTVSSLRQEFSKVRINNTNDSRKDTEEVGDQRAQRPNPPAENNDRIIQYEKITSEAISSPTDLANGKDASCASFSGLEGANENFVRGLDCDIVETSQQLNVANLVRESLAYTLNSTSIIDTDGTESDVTGFDEEQRFTKAQSLLMSPSLITKRFQQALHSIELRNWEQLSFLIHANPWLMEMTDVRTEQFLVHSLALFGGGQNDVNDDPLTNNANTVSNQMVRDIIGHLPTVVHKLDNEGNLPLHMAAASSNVIMIEELGNRFPGAASVQNHDGLLPLHLAIMSCALFPTGEQAVELILNMFPGAVCIKDNDGNTPLHVAAGTLKGDVGVDIIYQLISVCNDLAQSSPSLLKESLGMVRAPKESDEEASVITATTEHTTDFSVRGDSTPSSYLCMAKNFKGETPLARAIKSFAGWQLIEALLSVDGGNSAVLDKNSASQNALHLVLDSNFNDAAVALSILKSAPSTASIPDGRGTLPIQLACMNSLQREIILAIAIIDLPIDLGTKEEAIVRTGFGASWWFLICESNDQFVDVVKEILSLCSHPQKMALCLTTSGKTRDIKTAIGCATPQCKMELRRSLRFLDRFEFVGDGSKLSQNVKQFDAIDYGRHDSMSENGKKVSLRCYLDIAEYNADAGHLIRATLNPTLIEELIHFHVAKLDDNAPHGIPLQYCVCIDKAKMSLARVVAGMPKHHKYREDLNLLGRYFGKVKSVMRQIGKALSHLHDNDITHGNVDSHNICKFGDNWKITGILGSAVHGEQFATSRLGLHSPPEAFAQVFDIHSREPLYTPKNLSLTADPTVDVWAFGKLMYEVFVGESLFMAFSEIGDDAMCAQCISTWNNHNLKVVEDQLLEARIGSSGVELIISCLCPKRENLPESMSHVIKHPFWRDKNAFNLT